MSPGDEELNTHSRSFIGVVLIALILSWVPSLAQERPAALDRAFDRVESMTVAELAKDSLGSVTVGIVSGGDLVWAKSFGYADMERRLPATTDSVYRIGSITKQFTALMLLQLVDAGKLRLTDPVEKYFPSVNKVVQGRTPWTSPITLVQLATMTSGLDSEPEDLPTYLKGPVSEWEQVLVSALPRLTYVYEPDTHYFYSNIGYAILGAAMSHAIDRPYVEYVKERIFSPLGMIDTAWEPNRQIQDRLTKGYAVDDDGRVDSETPAREHQGRGYKVPNGAMCTTVKDLARFVAFELGEGPETVLKTRIWEDNLTRCNSSLDDLTSGYGIGFRVSRQGDFVAYGHGGSVAGYNAAALFHRPSKLGVIVLRNVGRGKFDVPSLCLRALQEVVQEKMRAVRQ